MREPDRNFARDVRNVQPARLREALSVEAMRECITPIMTSTLIARSVCDDRRAQLALEIIERQMHCLVHLLEEGYGVDMRPRLD